MLLDRCHSIGLASGEAAQQGFGLTPEMIEIGTRDELVIHGWFSMRFAWTRKQAARRTCSRAWIFGKWKMG
jgi:hypothetical protein